MPWRVEWRFVAERGLLKIHWRTASRIGEAIHEFSRTYKGAIERTDDPYVIRLRVRGAVALLQFDATSRIIHVLGIFGT